MSCQFVGEFSEDASKRMIFDAELVATTTRAATGVASDFKAETFQCNFGSLKITDSYCFRVVEQVQRSLQDLDENVCKPLGKTFCMRCQFLAEHHCQVRTQQ